MINYNTLTENNVTLESRICESAILKKVYDAFYYENGDRKWPLLAAKDIADFSYSFFLGYFLTEGINSVADIVGSENVYATTLLTVTPYVLSRCIDYGARLVNTHDNQTLSDFRTFSQRLLATGVVTGAGYLIGKLGVFPSLSNSDIMPLTAAGMLTGKTVELLLEKRNIPCPG